MGSRPASPAAFIIYAAAYIGDDCLLWPFSMLASGYGAVWYRGKVTSANRAVCEEVHGAPEGRKDSAHSCNNRPCVNGKHLSWKTRSANNLDKREHGSARSPHVNGKGRGGAHPRATMDEATALEILKAEGRHVDVAASFGVSVSAAAQIRRRASWRHLDA